MSIMTTFSVTLNQVSDTQIATAKTHLAFTGNDVAVLVNVTGQSTPLGNFNQAVLGGTLVLSPGTNQATSNEEKFGSACSLLADVFENGPSGWEESA